ncbi:MAG: 4Fe-4S binding protein [endosymbiont of Galathealinum brachiosum]|uniref:4Fe-4S binding protein n=1 Tax=endosymbiont of Galathealinum brachiosum TaxID=2200906 RepID=A0A370DNC0_9GAMM|nr:MAG: 4Fe-4S binding protein [endosymbiont of Galathealinum brachiosum]
MLAPTTKTQTYRNLGQIAFFALFMFAPVLDIFRLDLIEGNFILLGFNWTLGLTEWQQGDASAAEAALNILIRVFIPLFALAGTFIISSYFWGRLYCGWLCPHYTVVETINKLMTRAIGKPSLWENKKLPEKQADGSIQKTNPVFKIFTFLAIIGFAFLWAVSFMTYLLPPKMIYHNLFNFQLTFNQSLFIGVATILLSIEFAFARHFFCRFACAVGIFQSLAWMSNNSARAIQFDGTRADECKDCNEACDNVCPMRLKTRTSKRKKFTCTTCLACVSACEQVQSGDSLLSWEKPDENARSTSPVFVPLKIKKDK